MISDNIHENAALLQFHRSLKKGLALSAYEELLMKKLSNPSLKPPFVIPLVRLKRFGIVGSDVREMSDMFKEFRVAGISFDEGIDYSAASEALSIEVTKRLIHTGAYLQCLFLCYGMQSLENQTTQLTTAQEKHTGDESNERQEKMKDQISKLKKQVDQLQEEYDEMDVLQDGMKDQIADLEYKIVQLQQERDELMNKPDRQEELEAENEHMEDKLQESEERLEDANGIIDQKDETIEKAGEIFQDLATRQVCEVSDKRYEPRFAIVAQNIQRNDRLMQMCLRPVHGVAMDIDAKLSNLLQDHELVLPPIFVPNPKLLIQRSIELCETRIQREIDIWNEAIKERVRMARQDCKIASQEFARQVGFSARSSSAINEDASKETTVTRLQANATVSTPGISRVISNSLPRTSMQRRRQTPDMTEWITARRVRQQCDSNESDTPNEAPSEASTQAPSEVSIASTIPPSQHHQNELIDRRIACWQDLTSALREEKLTRAAVPITLNKRTIEWIENCIMDFDGIYDCFLEAMCEALGRIATDDQDLKIMIKRLKREFATDLKSP